MVDPNGMQWTSSASPEPPNMAIPAMIFRPSQLSRMGKFNQVNQKFLNMIPRFGLEQIEADNRIAGEEKTTLYITVSANAIDWTKFENDVRQQVDQVGQLNSSWSISNDKESDFHKLSAFINSASFIPQTIIGGEFTKSIRNVFDPNLLSQQ